MRIIRSDYTQPAILLGNGLNRNTNKDGTSWEDVLRSLSSDKLPENLFTSKTLNYPEFFDILSFRNNTPRYFRNLKKNLSTLISSWEGSEKHKNLITFAEENNIPILTTNFDTTLLTDEIISFLKGLNRSSELNKTQKPFLPKSQRYSSYLWHSYYSTTTISNALNTFGIWHIHGLWWYPNSLKIGALDYGHAIGNYAKEIRKISKNGYEKWKNKNSWLDIFLNCDLIIVGLGLSSEETSLRWLLMRREELFRNKTLERRKTQFVVPVEEEDPIDDPKKFFLNSINIELLEVKNFDEIYSDWDFV